MISTERRRTLEIKTNSGNSIQVTPEHRFKMLNAQGVIEWREAVKLSPGDYYPHPGHKLDCALVAIWLNHIAHQTEHGVVTINATYQHYKGGLYKVSNVYRDSEAEEPTYLVGYVSLHDASPWVRPLKGNGLQIKGWFDRVNWPDGTLRNRFEKVAPQPR